MRPPQSTTLSIRSTRRVPIYLLVIPSTRNLDKMVPLVLRDHPDLWVTLGPRARLGQQDPPDPPDPSAHPEHKDPLGIKDQTDRLVQPDLRAQEVPVDYLLASMGPSVRKVLLDPEALERWGLLVQPDLRAPQD